MCGVLVTVEDGQVVSITGNREHPLTRGFNCERARLAPKWLYHPGQLMYPLKRTGRRGEGKWERITWDQAFGEIGQKYGLTAEDIVAAARGVLEAKA